MDRLTPMNRKARKALARAISAGCMVLGTPGGFGMYFAGVATGERLRSLFGQRALDKSGYIFPFLCGSLKDVEPTDSVRNRYPLVFASKMGDFTGQLGDADKKKITKHITVNSGDKECHLNLKDDELREGSSVLSEGMDDMVGESLSYWDEKAIALLEANGNAFDGVAFFHDTHNVNGTDNADGTQSNLIAGAGTVANVADPLAPTTAEAAAILDEATDLLFGMQDLNGKLANKDMLEVYVVCGTARIARAFKSAVVALNGSMAASSNASLNIKYTVKQATGIAAGNVYIGRADAPGKTVVMQETAPETRFDPSSAKDADNWFTYKSERGVGLGVYWNIVKAVLS